MSGVSKRALINFIVDVAIGAAFVVTAVSGLVFLIPAGWLSPSGSTTSALSVDYVTWRTLHDWAGVAMVAGVVLHTALHWAWVKTMVRRLAGRRRTQARPASVVAGRRPPRVVTERAAASAASEREAASAADEPEPARATRHAFLKTASAIGGAALVGGLLGRAAAGAAQQLLSDDPSMGGSGSGQGASGSGQGGSWWRQDASDSGQADPSAVQSDQSPESGQSTQPDTSAARVTIDAESCIGCGDCLSVCPAGVFAASGGSVVVAQAEACRLCRRCTQVCRTGAITLAG